MSELMAINAKLPKINAKVSITFLGFTIDASDTAQGLFLTLQLKFMASSGYRHSNIYNVSGPFLALPTCAFFAPA